MSDLKNFIKKEKKRDPSFAKNYDEGYLKFKIGVLIKQARESSGFTQQELADKIHTKREAISRLENKSEDVKLSTLIKIAEALDKKLNILIE